MKALGQLIGRVLFAWSVTCFLVGAVVPQPGWCTPMVAITRPHTGDAVGAQLAVNAMFQSSSAEPILRLELLVDGEVVSRYTLALPQDKGEHSFTYIFRSEAGQAHRVSVRAVDKSGGVGEAIINVTVKQLLPGGGNDRTPPVVNIYYPAPGQRVRGSIDVKADVQDNVGVQWVFFYLDGRMKAMSNRPPFANRWDTTGISDGEHVLQARAWDAAENEGQSSEVRVTVANRDMTTAQRPAPVASTPTPPPAPAPAAVAPAPKVEAPAIPPAPPKRERAALPVPAPVVRQSQPAAPPALSGAVTAKTPRQAPAAAGSARIAALPKPPSVATERPGLPERPAIGENVSKPDGVLGKVGAVPSWSRTALQASPRPRGVQIAFQASTPLGTIARAIADAATTGCAPVAARTAPSTRPAAGAAATRLVRAAALPARTASPVEAAPAPLPPAELALAPRAPEVYLVAMLPPTSAGHRTVAASPAAAPQPPRGVAPVALARFRDVRIMYHGKLVPLGAAPEIRKGVATGPLQEIFARCDGVLYWFPAEKRVRGESPRGTMDLRLGQTQARVNGRTQTMELAPYVRQGHTMVPLSFLAEALNLTITFDATRGQLVISSKDK
jgi:hypothetical protein